MVGARLATRLVAANNRLVRRVDPSPPNPRPIAGEPWAAALRAAHPTMRAEWDGFTDRGGQIPLIEDLLGSWQGNVGSWWRAGALITRRRPRAPLADVFPGTVQALLGLPGLLSAMWSVLGPGGELPPHVGDNAGALNFLIGVDCPPESGLEVEGRPVPLGDGDVVVFDDTLTHATWNRSDRPRVLLLGDLDRRLPGPADAVSRLTQVARHHLLPSYRRAVAVGAECDVALNADLPPAGG